MCGAGTFDRARSACGSREIEQVRPLGVIETKGPGDGVKDAR
jgi:hypothetical protein